MAHLAINAPINGPMMKPIENAIPTKAIPAALDDEVETSVIIAIVMLTFPLLRPPMILAITKNAKLYDTAHKPYETAMPTKHERRIGFLPYLSDKPPANGETTYCRKENKDPRKPPNKTELVASGAPTCT